VGGTLTGRGADILIIDDPLKADDAESDVRREGANDWFHRTAMSRLNRPKYSLIAVVMQRLHQEDLTGVLLRRGWNSLIIPAIATENRSYQIGYGEVYRRKAGEVLQKEGPYSTDYAEQERSLGGSIFSAQYQQDPLPSEGNAVKREWLRRYDVLPPRFDKIVVSVDPAAAIGPRNDYTAILVVGVKDGFFYVLSAERGRWGIEGIMDAVERASREWKADLVLIENTSSGQSIIPLMRRSSRLDIKECNPDGNKLQRMSRHVGRIEAHRLLLPQEAPWLAEFEKELLAFPSARHDDQVDALVQFFEYYKDHEQFDNYDSVTVWGTFSNPWPDHMRIQRDGHSDNPFVVS
jgi:predicted phage terminase large subunit-like protein